MRLHHDEHLKNYVDTLNAALKDYPEFHNRDLTWLANNSGALPDSVRNTVRTRAGAVLNHNQYFSQLKNSDIDAPTGELAEKIEEQFGSLDNFKEEFLKNAEELFGSGWTFLVMDKREESFGELSILNLINQDRPSNNVWETIIALDVWEHSYYLLYQNRRREYLDAWWQVVDWDEISKLYNEKTQM